MIRYWLFSLLLALPVAHASALLENTGHQRLAAKLGADLPDGKGVIILQVEASTRATHKGVVPAGEHRTWIPDVAARGLDGQPIELLHPPLIEGTSAHATAVARFLVGTRGTGMATGVERLDVIDLRRWLGFGYLRTGSVLPPATPGAHLLNHSWAARLDTKDRRGIDADILRRIDWLADREEVLSVAGIRNTAQQLNQPLLASARNALIVGKSDGEHSHGTAEFNHPDYPAGRNRPHLVVPVATSSGATPVVTSAAALLLQAARATQASNTGDRVEVLRAALMAGAARTVANRGYADITDYRAVPERRATNGLDSRLGAGQLDVFASWEIIAAGAQAAGRVSPVGFNYADDVQQQDVYELDIDDAGTLAVTLAWNLRFPQLAAGFAGTTAVYTNLDLCLDRASEDQWQQVDCSSSTAETTENLYAALQRGRYRLRVVRADGAAQQDYGLAWRLQPVQP